MYNTFISLVNAILLFFLSNLSTHMSSKEKGSQFAHLSITPRKPVLDSKSIEIIRYPKSRFGEEGVAEFPPLIPWWKVLRLSGHPSSHWGLVPFHRVAKLTDVAGWSSPKLKWNVPWIVIFFAFHRRYRITGSTGYTGLLGHESLWGTDSDWNIFMVACILSQRQISISLIFWIKFWFTSFKTVKDYINHLYKSNWRLLYKSLLE